MSYLILGLALGLGAGVSPGPLLTLVITASLRRGLVGGVLVALAPLLSDSPIIILSILLLDRLPPWAITAVSVIGGLVVIYLGIDALRSARHAELPSVEDSTENSGNEIWKGVLVNLLNPNPYLFWATVGGPILLDSWRQRPLFAVLFLSGFYVLMVGETVIIAWLVAGQRHRLPKQAYRAVLAVLGLAMVVLGVMLVRRAWTA